MMDACMCREIGLVACSGGGQVEKRSGVVGFCLGYKGLFGS